MPFLQCANMPCGRGLVQNPDTMLVIVQPLDEQQRVLDVTSAHLTTAHLPFSSQQAHGYPITKNHYSNNLVLLCFYVILSEIGACFVPGTTPPSSPSFPAESTTLRLAKLGGLLGECAQEQKHTRFMYSLTSALRSACQSRTAASSQLSSRASKWGRSGPDNTIYHAHHSKLRTMGGYDDDP